MDARGYHLTNLLLHCANALLIYFIARRVLALAAPDLVDGDERRLGSAAAVCRALLRDSSAARRIGRMGNGAP